MSLLVVPSIQSVRFVRDRLQKSGARRLLRDADSEKRMAASTKVTGKHRSLGLQGAGFWDEAPTTLPSLAALAAEVEAELSFADGQRSTVAQVLGHVGSGPASVAADAAARLLAKGFWSTAVRVGMKVRRLGFQSLHSCPSPKFLTRANVNQG